MDFGFNEEQELLRNSVADFCARECGHKFLFEMWEDGLGYSREMWRKMAELGWLGLLVDEEYGGMGLGFVELAVILEEMGKSLLPSPYLSTVVLFGQCVTIGASDELKNKLLPKIAGGELIGTMALIEESGGLEEQDIKLEAKADGGAYVLDGVKLMVPDAHAAGAMVVVARTEGGVTLFVVDAGARGVTIKPMPTMDMLRRVGEVTFDSVAVDKSRVLGEVGEGWQIVESITRAACAALSVEMVGVAQHALDLSVDYAKARHQFGKPIGTFQAIKHKCAQMLLQLETARSAAYYAAWSAGEDSPDAALASSVAKAWCGDACKTVCADAIQVHGGIGFTWEFPLHMYFKRAQSADAWFGNASRHRELIARRLI